jgi:hypothetical protein
MIDIHHNWLRVTKNGWVARMAIHCLACSLAIGFVNAAVCLICKTDCARAGYYYTRPSLEKLVSGYWDDKGAV